MKYKYRHQGYTHIVESVTDEEFANKGFDEHFIRQYRKYAPGYEPFYDHSQKSYKMVSMEFLRKYGIKLED